MTQPAPWVFCEACARGDLGALEEARAEHVLLGAVLVAADQRQRRVVVAAQRVGGRAVERLQGLGLHGRVRALPGRAGRVDRARRRPGRPGSRPGSPRCRAPAGRARPGRRRAAAAAGRWRERATGATGVLTAGPRRRLAGAGAGPAAGSGRGVGRGARSARRWPVCRRSTGPPEPGRRGPPERWAADATGPPTTSRNRSCAVCPSDRAWSPSSPGTVIVMLVPSSTTSAPLTPSPFTRCSMIVCACRSCSRGGSPPDSVRAVSVTRVPPCRSMPSLGVGLVAGEEHQRVEHDDDPGERRQVAPGPDAPGGGCHGLSSCVSPGSACPDCEPVEGPPVLPARGATGGRCRSRRAGCRPSAPTRRRRVPVPAGPSGPARSAATPARARRRGVGTVRPRPGSRASARRPRSESAPCSRTAARSQVVTTPSAISRSMVSS